MTLHTKISEEREGDAVVIGSADYAARRAVRELVRLHGPTKAALLLSLYLEQEKARIAE